MGLFGISLVKSNNLYFQLNCKDASFRRTLPQIWILMYSSRITENYFNWLLKSLLFILTTSIFSLHSINRHYSTLCLIFLNPTIYNLNLDLFKYSDISPVYVKIKSCHISSYRKMLKTSSLLSILTVVAVN